MLHIILKKIQILNKAFVLGKHVSMHIFNLAKLILLFKIIKLTIEYGV